MSSVLLRYIATMGTTLAGRPFDPTSQESVDVAGRLTRSARRMIRDLKRVRMERGMSMSDVADSIGIHKSGVSRFESQEKSPRLETVLRYAHAVGADIAFAVDPVGGWGCEDSSVVTRLQAWKRGTLPEGADNEDGQPVWEQSVPLSL